MKKIKLLRNKKGFNDMFLVWIILLIFVLTATFVPFINDAFNAEASEFDAVGTLDQVQQDAVEVKTSNAFNIMLTTLKLALWNVGNALALPFWLSAFFQVLSTLLLFIVARNLWIGGGA